MPRNSYWHEKAGDIHVHVVPQQSPVTQLVAIQFFRLECLAGAFNCKLLIIKEFLDIKKHLNVFAAEHPLAGVRLLGREAGEFGLPISQHIRFHADELAHLANTEEELVRNGSSLVSHPFIDILSL